ncbi:hypothetical protein [Desulforegula conservatrix]|uniref:hypothetical protein n=1 Tax=Desulforegula conservatrix TaxID=153026 RepID=UPI000482DABA|nr:hypothetical protein [Desulforegula conservatrix]
MNRTIPFLVLAFLFSGCVSASIVGYGKRYEYLLESSTTIEDVRNELGKASWTQEYHPPLAISKTREYLEYTNINKPFEPFVWNGNDVSKDRLASYCEVYTREGPYYNMERGQAYGMFSAITLGIGEIFMIPSAIIKRHELSNKKYSLTFWYDENKRFVGVFKGDIKDPCNNNFNWGQ